MVWFIPAFSWRDWEKPRRISGRVGLSPSRDFNTGPPNTKHVCNSSLWRRVCLEKVVVAESKWDGNSKWIRTAVTATTETHGIWHLEGAMHTVCIDGKMSRACLKDPDSNVNNEHQHELPFSHSSGADCFDARRCCKQTTLQGRQRSHYNILLCNISTTEFLQLSFCLVMCNDFCENV